MTPVRVPLYSSTTHTLARIIVRGMVAFVAVGFLVGIRDLLSRPTLPQLAMLVVFTSFLYAFARSMLRAQPIFGTADGLVATNRADSRPIPWSKVGDVELPVSSFNPVFRRYYVTVEGEATRIYFFAGRREIDRLESFRRDARERATHEPA